MNNSPERKFEPWGGNGNGNGDKKHSRENPGEMLRSTTGALLSEIQRLKREIYVSMQVLAANSREISDADKEKIKGDLEAAVEELGQLSKILEDLEREMSN